MDKDDLKPMAAMTPEERLALTQEQISARLAALQATGFKLGRSGLMSVAPEDVKRLEPYAEGQFNPANPYSYEIGMMLVMAVGG